jgi:hypothetical protein
MLSGISKLLMVFVKDQTTTLMYINCKTGGLVIPDASYYLKMRKEESHSVR